MFERGSFDSPAFTMQSLWRTFMIKTMIRSLIMLTAVAAIAPGMALAADPTSIQRAEIATKSDQYVRSVVSGDIKTLRALTLPSFTVTTLEMQSLNADDLAVKWKIMSIEYGGESSTTKLNTLSLDGTNLTSVITLHVSADTLSLGREGVTTSLDAVHKLTWVPTSDGYKIASDVILRSQSS